MVVGLTGGMGMGKSTVAGIFARQGVPVFDADATVHRLQGCNGAALPLLAAAFPGTVTGGVLDRARLRAMVLAEPAALRRLERVMHPLVRAEERRFLARMRRAAKRMVLLDIPLLFETGAARRVDVTITVSAPRAVQMARLRRRRAMAAGEIAAMIAQQMPDAKKRARADYVVRTGLSRFHARRAVLRIIRELRK